MRFLGSRSRSQPTAGAVTAASRTQNVTWRDPRLWLGVALVAASIVAGARLLSAADDSVTVWALSTAAGAETVVDADQLVAQRVRFVEPVDLERYFTTADELPAELFLTRPVGAGELLPRSALGTSDAEPVVQVPVKVASEAVPPSVRVGSRVDVYVSDSSTDEKPAERVLEDVVVTSASGARDQFGAASDRQLVLAVPEGESDDLVTVIAAATAGSVTIVGRE